MFLDFKFKKKSLNQGFTLIEMVIVIGILAILGVFILTTLDPLSQFQKSNDAKRKSDLGQIQRALETYYQDNGVYPSSNASYYIVSAGSTVAWGDPWTAYMAKLPKDSNSFKNYVYSSTGQKTYYLYASLDRGSKDSQTCRSSGVYGKCSSAPVDACGVGKICDYGVSSPNVSP